MKNDRTETDFVRNVNGVWHTDFCYPSTNRVRVTLDTRREGDAVDFQEQYIRPLLRAHAEVEALEAIQDSIKRHIKKRDALEKKFRSELRGPMTNADLVNAYFRYRAKSVSAGSLYKYRTGLERFLFFLGDNDDLESVTTADIVRFRDWMDDQDIAKSLIKLDISTVRGFFKWLINDGKLARRDVPGLDVTVAGSKRKQHKPCPTREHADLLCDLPMPNVPYRLAWKMIPAIARYTGVRISEASTLWREDLKPDELSGVDVIHFWRVQKTDTSERMIPVSDKLREIIAPLYDMPPGPLFPDVEHYEYHGQIKYASAFLKRWNPAAKKIGKDDGIKYSFHCWRVYVRSALLSAKVGEVDINRIIGHSDDSTQEAYTPADMPRFKQAVDQIY